MVNSDATDLAVALDLLLVVRSFPQQRIVEIHVLVRKHPAYPTALFVERNVQVSLHVPAGIEVETGPIRWQEDLLQREDTAERRVAVRVADTVRGVVEATVVGHAEGGRVDADTELFYLYATRSTIQLSLDAPAPGGPPPPGTGQPAGSRIHP